MIEQLQHLAGSPDPAIAGRAQMALQIAEAFRSGGISQDEFKELMKDLVRTDKLNEECADLETKTMLVTAVYAVAQLA
jgi:hypothetical protein